MVLENEYNADSDNLLQFTYETLMALVDAIIPRTPLLAQMYGNIMLYGALDFYTDEYMYMILNIYDESYADLTAQLLNIAAYRYLNPEGSLSSLAGQDLALFAKLVPDDRFLALSLFDRFDENFSEFPFLQQYPGFEFIISSLIRFTMLGYYSEWFGYGTTRLEQPNNRMLQYDPLSWEQTGYPGPSLSYISYVNEYNLNRNTEEGMEINLS